MSAVRLGEGSTKIGELNEPSDLESLDTDDECGVAYLENPGLLPGAGAAVCADLAVLSADSDTDTCLPTQQPSPSSKGSSHTSKTKITVLIAEDDLLVQSSIANALMLQGFSVRLAADGVEALEIFEHSQSEINLLLIDCVMPKISGLEVAADIDSRFPDTPMVLMTADTQLASRFPKNFDQLHRWKIVRKPCEIEAIVMAIRSTLAARSNISKRSK